MAEFENCCAADDMNNSLRQISLAIDVVAVVI